VSQSLSEDLPAQTWQSAHTDPHNGESLPVGRLSRSRFCCHGEGSIRLTADA